MWPLFTNKHIEEAKNYRRALKRFINYKRDLMSECQLQNLHKLFDKITGALASGSRSEILETQERIDEAVAKIDHPKSNNFWRENVEAFLVAVIVAVALRAYFVQPFKIPTGSMQPTLFGIVGERTTAPPPNVFKRAFDMVVLGRTYVNLLATEDDTIRSVKETTYLDFFTFTTITGSKSHYILFAPKAALSRAFGISDGTGYPRQAPSRYKKGDVIARGYIDTGDQVLVDKVSYNIEHPDRSNVFVFKTTGIRRIEKTLPAGESQYFIKRLAGLAGDTLRIDSPTLYINGKIPAAPPFTNVMSAEKGYRGYSNTVGPSLISPNDTVTVPQNSFFALGDNSYNSLDSRGWGPVPQKNVVGRGLFVYWPFSNRWGFIH